MDGSSREVEIRRALCVLHQSGEVVEVRIPNAGRLGTINGYFDDPDALVREVLRYDGRAPGIYVTAHEIRPELLQRARDRLVEHAKQSTCDADVRRYRWLLFDLDPDRPAGIASTDAEHEAALKAAKALVAWLVDEIGIAADCIVLADSGNGAHVLVRIDEIADASTIALVKKCLEAADLRWSTAAVKVDTSVANPARIWRVYGTLSAKGDNSEERPHRRSKLLLVPGRVDVAPRDVLERLAAMAPVEPERLQVVRDHGVPFDLSQWLADHGLVVVFDAPWKGSGRKWILAECPFASDEHGRDLAAYVVQQASGRLAAGCHHSRCTWTWRDLRARYEGEHSETEDEGGEPKADRPRQSQATTLIKLAEEAGVDLFHDGDEVFASCVEKESRATYPVRSKSFRLWLTRLFYSAVRTVPGTDAFQGAVGCLEAKGRFDGERRPVFTRVGALEDTLYLDLGDDRWRVVEISKSRWRIICNSPVHFRRARGVLPLAEPVHGGSIDELKKFINVRTQGDWLLLVGWLVAAIRNRGPHPVLAIHGEQGAAKSTTCRFLRSLVDPNKALLRAEPRNPQDLYVAARNGWIVALDNLSSIPVWLSDVLCRLATGGGFSTRELYSDSEEVLIDVQRPVILNGINEVATRPDLVERCILLDLPTISEDRRQPESELFSAFESTKPRILGALLDAVVEALRGRHLVRPSRLPRMADFAIWAAAAAPGLGSAPEAMLAAYAENSARANDVALEASDLAPHIVQFIEEQASWTGTAGELLKLIKARVGDSIPRQPGWPVSARGMSGALRRIAPNLRRTGIEVEFGRGKVRRITMTRKDLQRTDATVGTDAGPGITASFGDGRGVGCDVGDGRAGDTDAENALRGLMRDGGVGGVGEKQPLSVDDVETLDL